MANALDLASKVALVTGSSRGIGAGIVRALNRRGARCVVNYVADPSGRNAADAQAIAAELREALVIGCDVSDAGQVEAMMARVRAELGGLDILVNNAGIMRDRTIRKMSAGEWESVLRVNLTGAFNCIHHASSVLRDEARIVNISSVSAAMGFFGQANYSASKAGLLGLTRVAARELASRLLTVNAVAPGFIDTEMTRSMPEDVLKQFLAQIPLRRLGQVGDVVSAVAFLCSPDAGYITGQVLHVSGGFYVP